MILNAGFMNECSLILAVSTKAIYVCILASILPCNLVKYPDWPIYLLAPFMADKLATLRLYNFTVLLYKFQYTVTGHNPDSLHESTQFVTTMLKIFHLPSLGEGLLFVICH